MYAIIESGSKQYCVTKGDTIEVERLELPEGSRVEFGNVLFLHNGKEPKVGKPFVAKSQVIGQLLAEVKGPKVINFKYKQRKGFSRKVGHRQKLSRVQITEIVGA